MADRLGYESRMDEIPDEEREGVTRTLDGGVLAELEDIADSDDDDSPKLPEGFSDNLVVMLSDSERVALGTELIELVEQDDESRKDWKQKMIHGMEIIGLKDIPEDSAAFDGAARVTHPALAEAMVQFQARAMEELLPPEGPVKSLIHGSGKHLQEQADRVVSALNYQLTEDDDQYYWDTDAMLMYLPYAGSAFKKVALDPVSNKTRSRFVPGEDLIVPYSATSLQTAPRYAHRYTIRHNDYLRAAERGYYSDDLLAERSLSSEQPEGRELKDAADDRTPVSTLEDDDHLFYEVAIDREFEWETEGGKVKYKKPYAITVDADSGKVVRIVRLWDPDDDQCKRIVWFSHYKYLPGFGFYGFGLLHLIGSLGRAAGGALRALLDGSMTASLQGGFKTRDARAAGEYTLKAGVWQDIDMTAEELAKSFYTPPFKEPSPALFKTLEIIINGIQRFASTTEAMVGDASNTGPVGTTVALIEQGSKIFSGIHKRLHLAARQEFKLIVRSNYLYMSDAGYQFRSNGELVSVSREDFDGRVDIIPVSDPNIFSSVQRIAIAQAVMTDVDSNPDIYDRRAKIRAHRDMLTALKVRNVDSYLPEGVGEKRVDPVTENQSMMTGGPAHAYAEQDHQAHIAVHTSFMNEVMSIGDPDIINRVVPAIKAHMAEHFAWAYRLRISNELMAKAGLPLPPYDPDGELEELPIDVENTVAAAVAALIPPVPPPQVPDPEAAKDEAVLREQERKDMVAMREQERKDMAAEREEARKDAKNAMDLQRKGFAPIPDGSDSTPGF